MKSRNSRAAEPCPHEYLPLHAQGQSTILRAKNWDNTDFYYNEFSNLKIIDGNLSECVFWHCHFQNCYFEDVCFAHSVFINCHFSDVRGKDLDLQSSFCKNGVFCPQSNKLFSTYGLFFDTSSETITPPPISTKNLGKNSVCSDIYLLQRRNFKPKNSLYDKYIIQPKIKNYFAKIKDDSLDKIVR